MFKIVGWKNDIRHSITWGAGELDNEVAQKAVIERLVALAPRLEGGHYVTAGQQECIASLSDSVFVFDFLSSWLDVVEKVEGETGLISEDDVVY